MRVDLVRYNSQDDYTDGMIFVNGDFICYTIEDEHRTKKVWGETRIPNGTYKVSLRKEGGFHNRYKNKFDFHKGMLCIYNQDNWVLENDGIRFQYILIHIGNTDENTAGCVLVGSVAHMDKNFIGDSTKAYRKLYPIIANALEEGEEVIINVTTN